MPPAAASDGPSPRSGGLSPIATGLVGLLVGLAIGAAVFSGGDGVDERELVAVDEVERSTLGADDAPVTLTVYSDFLCPYCEQHDRQIEPELVERYVESGEVRLVWHDLPLQGPDAVELAVAGRAAEQQDAFWEFKQEVFAGGVEPEPASLLAAAERLGLDTERFERDLDDPALELAVRRDREAAQQRGVQGTPSFAVGDRGLRGLQSVEALSTVIDEALAGDADTSS
ncbi:MAG: DsbA family protein [Actinomycetota bacterium]